MNKGLADEFGWEAIPDNLMPNGNPISGREPVMRFRRPLAGRLTEERRKKKKEWATATVKNLIEQDYGNEKVGKLMKKIKNGFDYWFTFLTDPELEPTNNRAKRALREHVVQRKIIGTLRNEKGMRIHETITTVLATWEQNGLDPCKEMLKAFRNQS